MYSKIQSVRYTKTKKFIWGDRFFEKKLGMALKQEIIAWKKISQNLGWAPHFLKDRKKSKQSDCLFWSHPKSYQESKKSTSYTVNGWETKIVDAL